MVLESHTSFMSEMRRDFDHPVQGSEVASRLYDVETLSQQQNTIEF